jgi:hypothetical protein
MTDSVVIEIPAETMDIGAIFTKSFFDKLGLKTDVVCVKCVHKEEHSGQEGGERPKELTIPYRWFYSIFSVFNTSSSSNRQRSEPNTVNTYIPEESPKSSVYMEKADTLYYKPMESTVHVVKQDTTESGDTNSFGDFLKNTIVSNPTKVDDKVQSSLYDIGKDTVASVVEPVITLKPVELKEPDKTKEEELKSQEEPYKTSKTVVDTTKSTVHLFDNNKESIKEFVDIWEKPTEPSATAVDTPPVLRIELFGKEIKRVESKTEYSHYMDEYLLKREIDIISNGRKKMVSTEYCEQYIVDGRYVILGAIEDKPQEDLKPEVQWNSIKNTEAYKKFVLYNII